MTAARGSPPLLKIAGSLPVNTRAASPLEYTGGNLFLINGISCALVYRDDLKTPVSFNRVQPKNLALIEAVEAIARDIFPPCEQGEAPFPFAGAKALVREGTIAFPTRDGDPTPQPIPYDGSRDVPKDTYTALRSQVSPYTKRLPEANELQPDEQEAPVTVKLQTAMETIFDILQLIDTRPTADGRHAGGRLEVRGALHLGPLQAGGTPRVSEPHTPPPSPSPASPSGSPLPAAAAAAPVDRAGAPAAAAAAPAPGEEKTRIKFLLHEISELEEELRQGSQLDADLEKLKKIDPLATKDDCLYSKRVYLAIVFFREINSIEDYERLVIGGNKAGMSTAKKLEAIPDHLGYLERLRDEHQKKLEQKLDER